MRKELDTIEQEAVSGGVQYTPDYYGAKTGVCGPNGGAKNYRYKDENDLTSFISAHKNDKEWSSIAERETYLINALLEAGIITPIA